MSLLGREQEVNLITNKIDANNILIITGVSGVGKSEIVKHIFEKCKYKPLIFSYPINPSSKTLKVFFNSITNYIMQENNNIWNRFINHFAFNKTEVTKFKTNFSESDFSVESLSHLTIEKKNQNISIKTSLFSLNLKKSKIILNGSDYIVFFKKFWELIEKNQYNVLYISNVELITNKDDFEVIKALMQFLPKHIKIVFSIGTLNNNFNDVKDELINIIKDNNLKYHEQLIDTLNEKQSLDFFNHYKEEYNLKDHNFLINKGIPLLILMQSNSYQTSYNYDDYFDKHLIKKDVLNFIILLTILYEVMNDFEEILKIARNLDIPLEKIQIDNLYLIHSNENVLELKHPLFYYQISRNYHNEILKQLTILLDYLSKNNNLHLYYFLKLKYLKNYDYTLTREEQLAFINMLIDLLIKFDFKRISSFFSFKENYFKSFFSEYQSIINLLEIQYNIYYFRLKESNFFNFNNTVIQLLSNILYLQYAYHLDDFQKVLDEANMIRNKLKERIYVLEDKDLIDYCSIIISALECVSMIALGDYNKAKNKLTLAYIESKNTSGYESISDYLGNLIPFLEGFAIARENPFFNDTSKITNEYTKTKRLHNICAVNLYTNFRNKTLEKEINQVIGSFTKINSFEISYSYNNLLVFNILNNKQKNIDSIIELIDKLTFESYDRISFYNNAIVANMIIKNMEKAKGFFTKALNLIREENFTDKSFLAKIYLNGSILFNILDDKESMNRYLSLIDLSQDYDDYILINEKISHIKNNKVDQNNFKYTDNSDMRYRFIYWLQIIHFWDFDIPVLNKKIMQYLLDKIPIQ